MSDKAVLVDFGLSVQMTEDVYVPRDLRGTEVREERTLKGHTNESVFKGGLHLTRSVCFRGRPMHDSAQTSPGTEEWNI